MISWGLLSLGGMMRNVDKYPDLPDTEEYNTALNVLIKEANGFVYAGDRAFGIMAALRVLRSDPELAARLLADE